MNEGQELLYKIIDNELKSLSKFDINKIKCDDINLVELSKLLDEDINNFYMVTDNIIDKIYIETNPRSSASFKKNTTRVRDLLIGKHNYELNIDLKKEYKDIIISFNKYLKKLIDKVNPRNINYEERIEKINQIKRNINTNKLVTDFEFIEEIVEDYDKISFEHNMVIIMRYLNEHNLNIIKTPRVNAPLFDIKLIIRPKLDNRIIEILDKLEISPKGLPNYLLSELKRCNIEEVYETFNLVKKNKAENYGILHLIDKNNLLAKLVLILYSTPESIKEVVDGVKDKNGNIDVRLLKVIMNSILPSFLVKKNQYFIPKHDDYMRLLTLIKGSGVNYSALIIKNPLFMITKYDVIDYVLKYFEINGALKKNVINRCYKTLSTNPALLIDNLMILRKYKVNIDEYLRGNNYNLLKVANLEKKINYIVDNSKFTLENPLDYDKLNKLIIARVFKVSKGDTIKWGE